MNLLSYSFNILWNCDECSLFGKLWKWVCPCSPVARPLGCHVQ